MLFMLEFDEKQQIEPQQESFSSFLFEGSF
jgi:hypothetical protein